jgi:hypothetical protein
MVEIGNSDTQTIDQGLFRILCCSIRLWKTIGMHSFGAIAALKEFIPNIFTINFRKSNVATSLHLKPVLIVFSLFANPKVSIY